MSQNLKDKLAAFIAMGVNPESEALVTALVEEVEQAGLHEDQMKTRLAGIEANEQRKDEFFADLGDRAAALESIIQNLKSVITEAYNTATTASTLSTDAANKVASHEQRLAQVERFAQPLLGVVEPEQTPPAQ